MTTEKSIKILKVLTPLFMFILPIAVTIIAYMKETATSGMSLSLAGLVIVAGVVIAMVSSVRKDIKMRTEMKRHISNYKIYMAYKFPGLAVYGGVVWFMWAIRSGADKLCIVLSVVGVFVVIGFILSLVNVHFENKLESEATPQ